MRKQPKPGQIGDYWLSKKPGREGPGDAWCRTWYDAEARQTRRVSLGTSDIQEATRALAGWVIQNDRPRKARHNEITLDEILLHYWEDHGKFVASPKTLQAELARWQEFWAGKTVDTITPEEQKKFRKWLGEDRLAKSTVDRVLSAGRSALNHAVRLGRLDTAPTIFLIETAGERESRPPMGDPITVDEMARFIDATIYPHLLTFTLIAANTLARPEAIYDLRPVQYDTTHRRLNLNPPGRIQTKKFRPVIPVSATLDRWLRHNAEPDVHYVNVAGRPIASLRSVWKATVERAGLEGRRITPYSFRHGMARQIRRRGVSLEELGVFMGHKHKGAMATTAIYAPDDPQYLGRTAAAIEEVMGELRGQLKQIDISDPKLAHEQLERVVRRRNQKYPLSRNDRTELERLIKARSLKPRELALKFGVSDTAIYKHMKRLGVPRKSTK